MRLNRAGNAATYSLGLLVLVLVFAALAGPAQSLRVQTQALQRQQAGLAPTAKAVEVGADWDTLTDALNFQPGDVLTAGELANARQALSRSYTAASVPITPGAFDGLASTGFPVTAGAAASATAGYATPDIEVLYRDPLTRYTQLVSGSYSGASVGPDQLGVTVTTATAARFGLHPGSQLKLDIPAGTITVMVTAVARVRDPGATFWRFDPSAGTPSLNAPPGVGGSPYWVGAVLADPDSAPAMQTLFGSADLNVIWELPVRTTSLRADQVAALQGALTRLQTTTPDLGELGDAASAATITSELPAALAAFLATQAEINTILLLLFVSLVVTGAAVIAVAARMVAIRRGAELTLARARGASLTQLAGRTLDGAAVVTLPAAAAGVALAFAAEGTGASSVLGWALAGLITATALAGPSLIAVWRHRRPAPAAHPALSELTGRRVPARRWVAEAAACVAAVAGLVVLHHQGLPAPGQSDLFLAITPVLVAVPVVLIVLRIFPLAVRGLLALTARARGATGFVALARASRSALTGVLPVFALVLGLTVAAFAGMVRAAVAQGETAASWQATGADVALSTTAQLGTGNTTGQVTPAIVRAFAAVPGVRHAAAVWRTTWQAPGGQTVTVLAVDPGQYAALTASTPFPRFPVARIARSAPATTSSPVAALASPSAAAALGPGVNTLTSQDAPAYLGPIRVRVSGQLATAAADPGGGAYLILPMIRLPGIYGQPAPQTLLLTGSGIDLARLDAVAARDLPTATGTFRSQVLASLSGAPLQRGADLIMLLTVLAAAGLGLCTLVFGLALGAEERELTLARLTTMGYERAVPLVLTEAMPAVLAAAAAGVACALALPRLVGSAVDLAVFTDQGTPVPLRPDWPALALPIAAVLVLAAATLAVETRTLRRRGVAALLRAH